MTPEQLKASILQLAIQGKLVPQRPEDGSAEDLYQQIQREKKKLTAAGKLKKEKPLPPITEEEIPFDIPDSWKWVRLQSICSRFSTGPFGTMLHKCDYSGRGIPVINPTNIISGSIVTKKVERVSEQTRDRLAAYKLNIGDIVLARRGNLAKSAAVGKNENGWLCGTGSFMIHPIDISSQWFCRLYVSQYAQSYLLADSVGTTMNNLNQGLLGKLPLPLPPLAEQQRIVEKIEQMLPLVEQYGEAYTALESLDARFPDDMRKSILQYAIQGKLVPQRPEEGTAEDLYRQIQKEKKKLTAAGKLKKEKPLPPITEEEIPFDIPDSWKWVRLGELGVFERGSGIKKSEVVKEGLPCVRYGQLYTTYKESFEEAVSFVPEELFARCKQAHKGDILMALTGENKPDIALAVVYEGENAIAIGGDMTRFTPIHVNSHYLMKVINSPLGIAQKVKTATGDIIVHTSNDKLAAVLIPLPPLAEQRRIVNSLMLSAHKIY